MPHETLEHDIAGGIAEVFGMSDKQRDWMLGFVKTQLKRAKSYEQVDKITPVVAWQESALYDLQKLCILHRSGEIYYSGSIVSADDFLQKHWKVVHVALAQHERKFITQQPILKSWRKYKDDPRPETRNHFLHAFHAYFESLNG